MCIIIGNMGPHITSTNYFKSVYANQNVFYLTFNAGTARLLVPPSLAATIKMETRKASSVEIIREPTLNGAPDAPPYSYVLLFDDGQQPAFTISMGPGQFDHVLKGSQAKQSLPLRIYTQKRGKVSLMKSLPGTYSVEEQATALVWAEQNN